MGVSLARYRLRIGSHNSFIRSKEVQTSLKGQFWNNMLMVIYLSVFYAPTLKHWRKQYKKWNEVMFRFNQIICYHVYVPLLIRQANDVEEILCLQFLILLILLQPCICADFNQRDHLMFGINAGKECVAMSLTSIILTR